MKTSQKRWGNIPSRINYKADLQISLMNRVNDDDYIKNYTVTRDK